MKSNMLCTPVRSEALVTLVAMSLGDVLGRKRDLIFWRPISGMSLVLLPVLVILLATFTGCAVDTTLERSRRNFETGDRMTALMRLAKEVKDRPGNAELRTYYIKQRDALVLEKLSAGERAYAAGRFAEARAFYIEVQAVDPDNARARIGLEELNRASSRAQRVARARTILAAGDDAGATRIVRGVLAEAPDDRAARDLLAELQERVVRTRLTQTDVLQGTMLKPVTLEFRDTPLRVVFEALSRASGLNFVFDKEVQADSRVTLFVRESSVDEVIRLLGATQGIERKQLNANSVLIYPATAGKQREHLELVTRSFYLANADAKSAQTMLKQLVKIRDVFIDEKLNLVVIKDTSDAVRLAERLIATLDVPEPEVMLELEVLEVSRSKLLDLGLQFPDQIGYGLLTPNVLGASQIVNGVVISGTTQLGGKLLDGNINLRDTGSLVPYVSNPMALLRLRSEDGDTSILANPRIRVRNREKAKVHIGEKLPLFTTTSTANVGVSASVSYLDVGLKLEVEPSVYRDDDVGIKLNLEVSNIVKEVSGPSNSLAYQVGTRTASTALRLRNGETQVLAGLINNEDRKSAQRIPGLGDLPLLGRLFSAKSDSSTRTEIVLLVTPRIVRNVLPPVALLADTPAGTETNVGAEPLRLGATAPGSLGLIGSSKAVVETDIGRSSRQTQILDVPALNSIDSSRVLTEIDLPDSAQRGESITTVFKIRGLGNASAGVVMVRYDPEALETGDAAGKGVVNLPIVIEDGTAEVSTIFLVKPDASGGARILVTGVNVIRDGKEQPLSSSAVANLKIAQ